MSPDGNVAERQLPPATGPCAECLSTKLPKVANPQRIVIYCEHNQAGAVMYSRNGTLMGQWLVMSPVSAGQWTSMQSDDMLPVLPQLSIPPEWRTR